MRKTKHSDAINRLAVDINELAAMLSCGKATARKIGESAGAKMKIGRRVLYSINKIENYIENVSEGQS